LEEAAHFSETRVVFDRDANTLLQLAAKCFTLDQTRVHARPHHSREKVAVMKPAMAFDRERRMVGNLVLQIEAAEPAIAKRNSTSSHSPLSKRMP
jgi:hypothetical protein